MRTRIARRVLRWIGFASLSVSLMSPGAAGAQQDQAPPPKAVAPHELIARIARQVELVAQQQILKTGQAKSLLEKLEHAREALQDGKLEPAADGVDRFRDQVLKLTNQGVLDAKTGKTLSDQAAAVTSMLLAVLDLPAVQPPALSPCAPNGPCTRLVLHVTAPRGPTSGTPDGTPGAPFPRIADALAHAAAQSACGVDIVLGDGTYEENVVVTRPTSITGVSPLDTVIVGSILNHSAHELSLSELHVLASPAPGAVVVDGACPAVTTITRMVISSATGHGIFQSGGSLRALRIVVRGTGLAAADPGSGVGIRLVGGVQAVLGDVLVARNDASGLAVSGPGTRVYVESALADENHVNPALFSPDGATGQGGGIEASDHALLLAEFTNISHSQVAGLHVGSGARAHYRYGQIFSTVMTPEVRSAGGVVVTDATAELSEFSVILSEVVGIAVLRSAVTLTDGLISHAPIGHSRVAGPDDPLTTPLACLGTPRGNDYQHVVVPYQGDDEVPCHDCPPPLCPSVPFECTWCAATVSP